MRLLVIEDNLELADALSAAFERHNVHCDMAYDAGDGEQMALATQYSAIILDLGLPDEDGLALLRRLRARGQVEPIVILTARGDGPARIEGLNLGADDYLAKPFLFDELQARIEAIMRRQGGYVERQLTLGNIRLDLATREVNCDAMAIEISTRESEVLEILMRRAGHVVPKRVLEDQLFGAGDTLGSNAVEVYVHRLRRRFETANAMVRIQTVRGVGYLMLAA